MINYNKKERRGLPGGPNEQFSYVTGFFTQSNPFRSMIQYQDGSEVLNAPLRTGKRQNNDGSYSTHLMAREYIPERGWVVFPTLFQNEDGSWLELSTKNGWYDAYQEAIKRNEVIDFGEDEKAAINYADKGKWKKNYKIAEPSDNIKTKRLKGYQDGAETYDYSKNLDFETMQQYVQEVGMPYAWRQFNDAEKAMYRKVMSQFNYPDQPVDVYDPRGVNAEYYQGSDGQTYMQNLPAASIKDIPLAAGKYIKEFDDRYPKPKGSNLVEDWENKRNEYVVQGILKDNPELTERDVEYINSLTDKEREILMTLPEFKNISKKNFSDTYSEARKAGQKEFTWMGKKFNTERANKNPYQTSTFETSIIPYTYLSARFGLLGNRDNMVREKRKINLDEGKLYFSRIGEATDGKVIIGGDYVEEEPTSYPAYMFKNNITERYTKLGEKIKLDNDTQLYYGIVNNKFKTGLINEFNDDDIVVPIRYGGKYDKRDAVQIDPEFINIMEPIYKLGPLTVDTNSEDFKNFVKNTKRPFLDSIGRQIGDYVQYKKNKLFKDSGLEGNLEEALDKYKTITGNTFVRNGVPIYNSGADGKLILHSPSKNKQLFLYKYTLDEIQDISQKFLEEYPDAEFISMDTGRYNFLVENPEGLSVDDFITYYENDLKRDKKIGYNIVYDDMNYKYKDGIRKKRYYSDKELLNLDVNKKNFNTLSLQKELFNRGYSLPNSIKEDGSFDGIFGDEVKEALLDWQSKNNKKRGGERRLQRGGMSKDGYKRYSPDVNNDYNIIPSGNITMKDVDFPVMGIDNFGNKQMMYPGYDYVYPGNTVFEIPMLKKR